MFKYFKYLKEMRELKKKNLIYVTDILGKVHGVINSIPDIAEMATKLQGLDGVDFQKGIAEVLVGFVKGNEENSEE